MPTTTRPLLVVLLALATACGGGTPPAPQPAKVDLADDPPTALRLPTYARPLGYRVELTLDPDADGFSGVVQVDLELDRPTRTLWLNGKELVVDGASVIQSGHAALAVARQHDPEVLAFELASPIEAGKATLEVRYHGRYDDARTEAIYRVAEPDGTRHVYSMFEATHARRAIPSFDDPHYKVPWTLSFKVRKGQVAVANEPVTKTSDTTDGWTLFEMEETPPLPSYLVAFMAGPFEIVDAGTAGTHGTPLRFIIPRGRAGELGYAREVTPRIVTELERLFGMKIPFRKLDVAVVPRFWGTMEHPGIVALGQPLTLIKPEEDRPSRREAYANIAIHELCHYWFGDYVTMAWWNDAWLNEGLGTWCDATVTQALEPSWRMDLDRVGRRGSALGNDEAASAKSVRSEIESAEDIEAAFDSSTYNKGGAIARMIEMYVGPDEFRDAIRAYLDQHKWGSATTESFLASMDASLPGVGKAMASFVERNGAPLLTVGLTCEAGKARLSLAQERVVALGAAIEKDRTWTFPVCVRYGDASGEHRTCHMLDGPSAEVALDGGCPTWLVPNADGAGYYRVRLDAGFAADAWQKGYDHASEPERVALVSDLSTLSRLGAVPVDQALAVVPEVAASKARLLASQGVGLALSIEDMLDPPRVPRYQRWIRDLLGKRARALGWVPKAGESPDDSSLRRSLLSVVANSGADPELRKRALDLARRYLKDSTAIHDEMVSTVLWTAALTGGEALFDDILAHAKAAKDHRIRGTLFTALGAFPEPALADRALALTLDTELDLRDTRGVIFGVAYGRYHRERMWAFLQAHFDELAARMTEIYVGNFLVRPVGMLCDASREDEIRGFYRGRLAKYGGAQLDLDNTLDDARTCSAVRAFQTEHARAFVDKLPKKK